MFSISKYIYWALVIGIAATLLRLLLGQMDMATIAETEVFPWYFKTAYLGNILISFASVASFSLYRKFFPGYVSFCYILIILLVIITSLDSFAQTMAKPTFFYSLKGIGTYINFGILFFAADTKYFPKILNLFYYGCFVIIGASLISLSKVGLGASRKEFLTYIRDYTVFLIWVFPYFFLQKYENKKKNLINIAAFLLIFVFVFSSGSRSYLLLYFVYVIAKFKTQLQSRNGLLAIGGIIILAVGGYFAIMSTPLGATFDNAFANLSERSGEDTRSDQLLDFLSQYDMAYLIQGVGPVKLWFWHGINEYYPFLDNQFLLLAWWAGLPTVLVYCVLVIRPLFSRPEILLFEDIRGIRLIIGFWAAACAGLAIYITINSEPYYFFISFLIGMATCQYTKIFEDEPAEAGG